MRDVTAGATIVAQGEAGDALYLIVTGEAEVVARNPDGAEQSMGVLASGDFFGEISLLENRPRVASVVARTPMTLMRLDREGFDALPASLGERSRGHWRNRRETRPRHRARLRRALLRGDHPCTIWK